MDITFASTSTTAVLCFRYTGILVSDRRSVLHLGWCVLGMGFAFFSVFLRQDVDAGGERKGWIEGIDRPDDRWIE